MKCIICKKHFVPRNSLHLTCGKECSHQLKKNRDKQRVFSRYKIHPRILTDMERERARAYSKKWYRRPEVWERKKMQRQSPIYKKRGLEAHRRYYKLHPEKLRMRYYRRFYVNRAATVCLICNKASSVSPCPDCWTMWVQLKQRYKALKATLKKMEVQHE